jgi:Fur family peroxide stress response transcriptional regulator
MKKSMMEPIRAASVGSKYSRQREVILKLLKATRNHPNAQWIYERARQQLPRLSLGTVYRNLRMMEEVGTIRRLAWGGPQERYDGTVDEHNHVICDSCGAVVDIEARIDKDLIKRAARESGMSISGHRLDFHGLCEKCAKKT